MLIGPSSFTGRGFFLLELTRLPVVLRVAPTNPINDMAIRKKRARVSKPLFVKIKLGKLKRLLDDRDGAEVTVSRNFIMNLATAGAEAEVEKKLGLK